MSVTQQGIFWLASYPKSGNTWFRIVLSNALNPSQQAFNINQINVTRNASSRALFVEALGFNSYLLSEDELLALRPIVYQWYSQQNTQIQYFKIHDAYIYIKEHIPLVPVEGSLGALYFIRNPLDVAISFAHHCHISIDQSIDLMCYKNAKILGNIEFIGPHLEQHLLSWSQHVESWTITNNAIPVMCIRYEDMHLSPFDTFKKALKFLNIDLSEDALLTAINHARFENLQQLEAQQGFCEKSFAQKKFFRKGMIGDWEQTLNPLQIKKIIEHHKDLMVAHGYLDEHLTPIRSEKSECKV
ncbi:MAG: sulfotransferase domain-containing protein [Gammaproteobacteria bacterium]|nr:sulfotransferase domain-containing protein [Gammaproteobacteria bacterium]